MRRSNGRNLALSLVVVLVALPAAAGPMAWDVGNVWSDLLVQIERLWEGATADEPTSQEEPPPPSPPSSGETTTDTTDGDGDVIGGWDPDG